MASLEMLDSLWYLQTPERVKNLIKNYTKNNGRRFFSKKHERCKTFKKDTSIVKTKTTNKKM